MADEQKDKQQQQQSGQEPGIPVGEERDPSALDGFFAKQLGGTEAKEKTPKPKTAAKDTRPPPADATTKAAKPPETTQTEKDAPTDKPKDSGQDNKPPEEKPATVAEKRISDAQAKMHEATRAKAEIERQLTAARVELDKLREAQKNAWYEENPEENPVLKTLETERDEARKAAKAAREAELLAKWDAEAARAGKDKPDFEAVLTAFEKDYQADPKLQAEFKSKGATPEVAYEMGKRLETERDARDPDKLRERIKKELLEEFKATGLLAGNGGKTQHTTLTGEGGQPPLESERAAVNESPLDGALRLISARRR